MMKLKNKICQGTLEIIFPGIEKAEAEKNNIGSSGWSCCRLEMRAREQW